VRNKYCVICQRHRNHQLDTGDLTPCKEHDCNKNHDGPSTTMEANILADGFGVSLKLHDVIYHKFIEDGETAVYMPKYLILNLMAMT
jgi:hypothetical protein